MCESKEGGWCRASIRTHITQSRTHRLLQLVDGNAGTPRCRRSSDIPWACALQLWSVENTNNYISVSPCSQDVGKTGSVPHKSTGQQSPPASHHCSEPRHGSPCQERCCTTAQSRHSRCQSRLTSAPVSRKRPAAHGPAPRSTRPSRKLLWATKRASGRRYLP